MNDLYNIEPEIKPYLATSINYFLSILNKNIIVFSDDANAVTYNYH